MPINNTKEDLIYFQADLQDTRVPISSTTNMPKVPKTKCGSSAKKWATVSDSIVRTVSIEVLYVQISLLLYVQCEMCGRRNQQQRTCSLTFCVWGSNFIVKYHPVNMSQTLIWHLIRDNNSFMVKRERTSRAGSVQFSSEPGNLMNAHSFKYSGLANNRAVDISSTGVIRTKVRHCVLCALF